MLRSRKRTCRRSKSRCGGTRQASFAGRGGGRSRRGGRLDYYGGLGAAEGSLNGGVINWQTVGGSHRDDIFAPFQLAGGSRRGVRRSKSRCGGTRQASFAVRGGGSRRGVRRSRRGGAVGRNGFALGSAGSLGGDLMRGFSKGGGGISPWAHEHGTIGLYKGGGRGGGDAASMSHGRTGVALNGAGSLRGGGFPYQIDPASSVGGHGAMVPGLPGLTGFPDGI